MTKPQTVFKRCEKKYLLSRDQYDALLSQLQEKMTQDVYGEHTICSLYFDTPEYDLIRTSIEKPVYKEKLRLRSYGVPSAEDQVFIELKKKYKGVVYKRRVAVSLKEAADYLFEGKRPSADSHVISEIDWFQSMYHVAPKVLIAYERCAWYGNEEPGLRVTFDRGIRFRETALDLAFGDWGQALLEEDRVLMEIKIPGAMPLWLSRLLSELKIYPTSFSKYGMCYKVYLFGEKLAVRDEEAKPAVSRLDYHYTKQGGGLSA